MLALRRFAAADAPAAVAIVRGLPDYFDRCPGPYLAEYLRAVVAPFPMADRPHARLLAHGLQAAGSAKGVFEGPDGDRSLQFLVS
jgi:hypothetical protein